MPTTTIKYCYFIIRNPSSFFLKPLPEDDWPPLPSMSVIVSNWLSCAYPTIICTSQIMILPTHRVRNGSFLLVGYWQHSQGSPRAPPCVLSPHVVPQLPTRPTPSVPATLVFHSQALPRARLPLSLPAVFFSYHLYLCHSKLSFQIAAEAEIPWEVFSEF